MYNFYDRFRCIFRLYIYIPPENSKYSSLEAFNEIESELIQLSFGCDYFSLIGDFNAKTGETQDYIQGPVAIILISSNVIFI